MQQQSLQQQVGQVAMQCSGSGICLLWLVFIACMEQWHVLNVQPLKRSYLQCLMTHKCHEKVLQGM